MTFKPKKHKDQKPRVMKLCLNARGVEPRTKLLKVICSTIELRIPTTPKKRTREKLLKFTRALIFTQIG